MSENETTPIPGWDGFYDPNYTPIPDDFFDVVMPYLSEVELRVLLYIMRRTYGFKKRQDDISLTQIASGIVKSNGERLDNGAGVSERGAQIAVKKLEQRGILTVQRNRGEDGRLLTSTYSLRRAGTPTAQNAVAYRTDYRSPTALDAVTLPQQMPIQETVKQETVKQENIASRENASAAPGAQPTAPGIADPPGATLSDGDEQEADPGDSAPPPFSPYIAAVITDYSAQLHDGANTARNVTQAGRLWQSWGISEDDFVERLHAAYKGTQRGNLGQRNMRAFWAALKL